MLAELTDVMSDGVSQDLWLLFVGLNILNHHHHHYHHKHQGLDTLIRSVSRVTTASANASSVFQLFSFLVVCSSMISPVLPLEIPSWVGCPQDG